MEVKPHSRTVGGKPVRVGASKRHVEGAEKFTISYGGGPPVHRFEVKREGESEHERQAGVERQKRLAEGSRAAHEASRRAKHMAVSVHVPAGTAHTPEAAEAHHRVADAAREAAGKHRLHAGLEDAQSAKRHHDEACYMDDLASDHRTLANDPARRVQWHDRVARDARGGFGKALVTVAGRYADGAARPR